MTWPARASASSRAPSGRHTAPQAHFLGDEVVAEDHQIAILVARLAVELGGVAGAVQGVVHRAAQILGLAQADTIRKVVEVTVVTGGPTVIAEVRVIGEADDSVVKSGDARGDLRGR